MIYGQRIPDRLTAWRRAIALKAAEEFRLLYVGMRRAKQLLWMASAKLWLGESGRSSGLPGGGGADEAVSGGGGWRDAGDWPLRDDRAIALALLVFWPIGPDPSNRRGDRFMD
jgi:hypothetical protein